MKGKILLLVAFSVLGIGIALAQVRSVAGNVKSSEDGLPVVGATVTVKGTTIGTHTDIDGNFTLTGVPASAKYVTVVYVGMTSVETAIKPRLDVVLEPNSQTLDEVLVVAYGTTKNSSFSGSASAVKGERLQKLQVSNISKGLEGSVAGLQTSASSGTPGSKANIVIRGLGSISSSQAPLIVVDGVPYEGSLNSIATQDIESLTVLKDAAANSMYGARGSNGVIIITTKTSKGGKAVINADARWGVNSRGVPAYDVITDAGEYYELMYEAYRNSLAPSMGYFAASQYAASNLVTSLLKYNKFKGVPDNQLIDPLTGKLNSAATTYKWSDDWTKDPFQSGIRQEYNLSVSGGGDNTKAYFSLGYLGDEGIIKGSEFDRVSARVKVDQVINAHIKAGANIAYARTTYNTNSNEADYYSNIFAVSQKTAPIYPIFLYDADGNRVKDENGADTYDYGTTYGRPYAANSNPAGDIQINKNECIYDNVSTRGYVEAKFLNDFKFTANIAYDVFNSNESYLYSALSGTGANTNGYGYQYATNRGALNVNELLNWNHDFGGHNIGILLGHENKHDNYKYLYGAMSNYTDPNIDDFATAATMQDLYSYRGEYALEGYFAKADYGYKNRYFATASIRRDGSSKFYKDHRWGSFWSVGASWKVSDEDFMRSFTPVTFLKLKASYGTQGNDNLLNNGSTIWKAYEDYYTVTRTNGEPGLSKSFRGNKDLTWEKSNNFNVGFESRWIDCITFNFDFFIKETKDMIYRSPIAASEGVPAYIYRNEMNMRNTGVEFELSADIIKNKNMKWNVSLNATHYKNELTKLPDSKPASTYPDGYQDGWYWRKLGGSLYDWYTYEYAGVDAATGRPLYNKYTTDANGNQVVTTVTNASEASLCQTGKSAIPDLTGGFSTTFEAFGFDLSVATAFQLGGYVWDTIYQGVMNNSETGINLHKDRFNSWTPANTATNIPMLTQGDQSYNLNGDFFLTKASYFSLRNVTLGYSFKPSIIKKIGVEKLRIYFAGDNLWLKSARKGLDPRQTFNGTTNYVYSALRTCSFGINLTL